MIDKDKTKILFGYDIDSAEHRSGKKVVHLCDKCGKERIVLYKDVIKKFPYKCRECTMAGSNNYFHSHTYEGNKNCNYKDGRTSKDHYCVHPGCNKKIDRTTIYKTSRCRKHSNIGELNGNYIDGRTPLKDLIRHSDNHKQWSLNVFKKDHFKCQHCGAVKVKFTAHHLKKFSIILSEFLSFYSQFSPIEDKETLVRLSISWSDFWDVNNGITLCEDCHKQEHAKIKAKT